MDKEEKTYLPIITLAFIVLIIGMIIGLIFGYFIYPERIEVEKCKERPKSELQTSVDACLEKGGVPIYTYGQLRLKRCDYIDQ